MMLASMETPDQSDQAAATPSRLCQWCRRLVARLQPALVSVQHKTLDYPLIARLEHYPRLEELISGAKDNCHMCRMIADSICNPERETGAPKDPIEDYGEIIYAQFSKGISSIRQDLSVELGQIGNTSSKFDGFVDRLVLKLRDDDLQSPIGAESPHYPGSEACYRMIREWIHACSSQHQSCITGGLRARPTRLLDLNSDDSNDLRLVAGNTDTAPYATLSYCWGKVDQLMLLRTNYAAFTTRILFSDLSLVAQDAVKVCRGLLIRYLWIDALCIVQGDDGDFAQEAPRMGSIYGGCLINIASASAPDTSQHFLCPRDSLLHMDCELSGVKLYGHEVYLSNRFDCHGKGSRNRPGRYHIDTRAWFYQERFLSPRSVYFGPNGIHWECRKGIACDLQPLIGLDHVVQDDKSPTRREVFNNVAWHLKSKFAELAEVQSNPTGRELMTTLREI
ncbi:hypothetical protein OPT61_g8987 [Boeremia exigua]|uniref:Uncharacterized protein n=1 Tax=Boeremia exigua TaxID=749465 RepID=A0ACC2HWK8_9PLEO|nr:hypothetical protein OPT61_g8987 [Boeremia exigua]